LRTVKIAAPQMPRALRALALWHLASLDAPTVAVVWTLGFAWAAGVRLAAWVPPLLALTVWSVYVFDRLLDARAALRAKQTRRLRERHSFHWRHRRILIALGAISACAAGGLIFAFMPMAARERDSVLAAASFAYFARVHAGHRSRPFLSPLLTKELLVGGLFTAGCVLPVFGALRAAHASLWPAGYAAALFAALAWLNCYAIDKWESRRSRVPQGLKPGWFWLTSAARVNSCPDTKQHGQSNFFAACLLAAVGFLLAGPMAFFYPRMGALVAAGAVSALLLAMLDRRRESLSPVTLRAAADLVLLAPAPLLALAWLAR
jgi:hypothetical protein